MTHVCFSDGNYYLSTSVTFQGSVKGGKAVPSYQDRMEKIWAALYIPDNNKLDMAIKYSSESYTDNLEEVAGVI